MEWVETTGKTVDIAKEAALDQLGVAEADAEFVVVTEPRSGLFGLLRGEARVRARVVPKAPRPKRGRGAKNPRAESKSKGASKEKADGYSDRTKSRSAKNRAPDGDEPQRGSGKAKRQSGERSSPKAGSKNRAKSDESTEETSKESSNGRRSRSANSDGVDRAEGNTNRPGGSGRRREGADTMQESAPIEVQASEAKSFVEGLVREMGLAGTVSSQVLDESTAEIKVEGDGLGLLVGRGGTTIAAVQELSRAAVQRATGGRVDRILIDVAGYRAKRAEALQKFAQQVAQEVITSGTERRLEPMASPDRKVVHDAVTEIAGVGTRSEGEDPRRYVVIFPTDEAPGDSLPHL
jgi:spoIIIJ-associated protein